VRSRDAGDRTTASVLGVMQERADLMEKVVQLEAEVAERTSAMSAEAGAIALAAEAARAELAAAQMVR
jgi:hypothetical protein